MHLIQNHFVQGFFDKAFLQDLFPYQFVPGLLLAWCMGKKSPVWSVFFLSLNGFINVLSLLFYTAYLGIVIYCTVLRAVTFCSDISVWFLWCGFFFSVPYGWSFCLIALCIVFSCLFFLYYFILYLNFCMVLILLLLYCQFFCAQFLYCFLTTDVDRDSQKNIYSYSNKKTLNQNQKTIIQ